MKMREALEQAIALDKGNVTARLHTHDDDSNAVDLAVWVGSNGLNLNVQSPHWYDLTFKETMLRGLNLFVKHIDSSDWCVE